LVFLNLILAELKMDVLREREVKDSLERQLVDERKLRGESKIWLIYKKYSNVRKYLFYNIFINKIKFKTFFRYELMGVFKV